MEEEKIVQLLFGLATAAPILLGMYLTYVSTSLTINTLILFSLIAGLYSAMIYTFYEVSKAKQRLYNITTEKEERGENDTGAESE